MLYVCYMFSKHITCFKASVYRGLRHIMLYGYMFLRNSFFIQYRDTACGLRSPRLRGSKPQAPWDEGAASMGRRYGLHDP